MFNELRLKNFRNISEARLVFNPCLNIFLGKNGQGKSNLLEALFILSTGHSFRYADNLNIIKKGETESLLKTKILHGDFEYEVQIHLTRSKKDVFVQGKKTKLTELPQKFPAVLFSPESLAAIKEGGDLRRQLVDELIVTFDHNNTDLIAEFRKCLKTRNKVLRDLSEGLSNKDQLIGVLDSLNPIYLNYAARLTEQRILALRAILPDFNNAMQNISLPTPGSENVDISVDYVVSDLNIFNFDLKMITERLENRALQLRTAEMASGTSLWGPQKHDIRILYNQNDSRFYCSQGQQRALILSFKMAQIVYHRRAYGSYPVLMLDDVLSELDSEKRHALISFLAGIETQIFITTTDLSLPAEFSEVDERGSSKCSVFRISGGLIDD